MSGTNENQTMSEDQVYQYVMVEIIPRYQELFNEKFSSASFLIPLLQRNLKENNKVEDESKLKVYEVISKFIKTFGMLAQSLDEDRRKHALSLLYYVRSQIHKRQKNYEKCVQDLGSAIDSHFDCQFFRQRGLINFSIFRRYGEAMKDFEAILEESKEKNDIFGELHSGYNISKCLIRLKQEEKCIKFIDEINTRIFKYPSKSKSEEETEGEDEEEESQKEKEQNHLKLMKKVSEEWNKLILLGGPKSSSSAESHWGYFSIFLLLKAKCYLKLNMFEKAKEVWSFFTENFLEYLKKKDKVGNMCFCRDLEKKFGEFNNFRLFFMEYVINMWPKKKKIPSNRKDWIKKMSAQRNGNILLLRKVDSSKKYFSDHEVGRIRGRLESEEQKKSDDDKDEGTGKTSNDPYNVTKQLLLLKNAMPENVMGGSNLAQRMLFVLSQITLEGLTWTNPTLKYWSCNILDFKETLINTKVDSGDMNIFRKSGFYDPGRGRSILPLDNYRYLPISKQRNVREVFHIRPSSDPSLKDFLENAISIRKVPSTQFPNQREEIIYLAKTVMDVMGGNVHKMKETFKFEINQTKKLFPSLHPNDLLLMIIQSKLQKLITQVKKNVVLNFHDFYQNKVPGVCRHRAILFKLCCDVRNIPSRLVRGYLTFFDHSEAPPRPTRISHAWNLIKINGMVYIVDLMNGKEILVDWCSEDAEIYRSCGGMSKKKAFHNQIVSKPITFPLMFTKKEDFDNTLASCDLKRPVWSKTSMFSKTSKVLSSQENQGKKEVLIHKETDIKTIRDYFQNKNKKNKNNNKEEVENEENEEMKIFFSQKKYLVRYLNHRNLVSGQYDHLFKDKFFFFFKYYQLNAEEYLKFLDQNKKKNQNKKQNNLIKVITDQRIKIIEVLIFLINVLKGLRFLHGKGVFHNNLKLSNILVNMNNENGLINEVKISDFFGINSFQTFLVLLDFVKNSDNNNNNNKKKSEIKNYVIKNNLIFIPPEVIEFKVDKNWFKSKKYNGFQKHEIIEKEFRKVYFENKKFDIYSLGVIMKQFREYLHPNLLAVSNTCVSKHQRNRPKISTILKQLEGCVLKEFHKLGGNEKIHDSRISKAVKLNNEINRLKKLVDEVTGKLEDLKTETIKTTNTMKLEIRNLKKENHKGVQENKNLKENIEGLNKQLLIKKFNDGNNNNENNNKMEEIIGEKVQEKLDEEMKNYGLAIRYYKEAMEKKMNKELKKKDQEIHELVKQVQTLLQKLDSKK